MLRHDFGDIADEHIKDIIIITSYAKKAIWQIRQKSIHGELLENVDLHIVKTFQQLIQRHNEVTESH